MNNSLRDIGYLLIDNINQKSDSNKIKLFDKVNKYNNFKKEVERKKQENKEYYLAKYEELRKINATNYASYLEKKSYLFDKWKATANVKDLYEYISLERPEYIEVPDVYTSQFDYKIIK
uniref:Uncharacterized protein n=1 Tax=viral metagenome TaxID=1070528 RepID=A0A6C0CGU1_9ZZZZ